ncbi:hypothetical protein LAZ67_17003082 [Cordylochernes scorpioides]|uniref:Uncharacterized protein n=1 Tax=Cordylochernes scorpioides TaxID=51811 RepID=A0ABY6LEI8_9ARAC|nr:hypothetical protein LAZ67_17003082 [Cordylochernes scorpioides]
MSIKARSNICLDSNGTLGSKRSRGSIADFLYTLSASQSQYSFSSNELFDDNLSFHRRKPPGCRAPIASLECMEEGLLSSDSSAIFSRQWSPALPRRYK